MSKFFRVPAGYALEPDVNENDINIKMELVRAWYRETRVIDDEPVTVVVLVGTEYGVARDGEWSQQLESCTGGCDGGGSTPEPGPGAGAIRTAYGGMIAADPYGYTEVHFPAPDEWVILDSSKVDLVPYSPVGTDEYSYDLVKNAMKLDWNTPVPTNDSYTQGNVVWSVAATGSDQTYAFAWVVDGVPAASQGEVYLILERGGDIETLVQQGHREVSNGTELQLAVKNIGGTNLLRLYGLNWRMSSSNQDD